MIIRSIVGAVTTALIVTQSDAFTNTGASVRSRAPYQPTPLFAAPTADPVAASVARVEETLKEYMEASPGDREALLVPLREAMMAASSSTVGTNELFVKSEVKNIEVSAPPPIYTQAMISQQVTLPATSAKEAVLTTASGTMEDLKQAVAAMDSTKVTTLLQSGLELDEVTTDKAFWTVVSAVNRAEALDQPLSADVPVMLHHIFDADLKHLLTREQIRTNVTCMMPEEAGANRIGMNYIFDDSAHKDLPLQEGRRCEGGSCCDKCSRNIFPTFASNDDINFDVFPGLESLTFNELETVSAATILQFTRLVERVRRTIAHEYGLPLSTILPLQAYSRKYVAGTTQQGGGGGEGDFVTLHTDEATHDGYHYSCVLYLSTQGEDFEGGNFVFNDPDPDVSNKVNEDDYELDYGSLEEAIRTAGRKFTPFSPTRGAAVIFSSGWENMHEVDKITSGVRHCVPCFFTTCPVPEAAYTQMHVGKPKTNEDIADDWLHLLLAHRKESMHESLGRVKELLMKWHMICTPLSEH
jgi:hypothetical protein